MSVKTKLKKILKLQSKYFDRRYIIKGMGLILQKSTIVFIMKQPCMQGRLSHHLVCLCLISLHAGNTISGKNYDISGKTCEHLRVGRQ